MAVKYSIPFQICTDAAGQNGVFIVNVPIWVYTTAEYNAKKAGYIDDFGTAAVTAWRNNPIALTDVGVFIRDNMPHLLNGCLNIASEASGGSYSWYDEIMTEFPGIGPLKNYLFSMLPITQAGVITERAFYMRRISDGAVFGPYHYDTYETSDPIRGNSFSTACPLPYFVYGSGTGSSSQGQYYWGGVGLFVISDDFSGTITTEDIHTSSVGGYLDYSPREYITAAGLFDTVLDSSAKAVYANVDLIPSDDPYEQAGNSGTGGGQGTFDLQSDSVDFPALPTLTAVDTGLVSVYTPTLAQLKALAAFLWNANPTDVDWWKKLVANPLDLVLGLSIVPVSVPAGATQTIKVGLIDTGVSVTKAASQFVEVDCGSLKVDEYWGSALDYSPFRRFSIYLPFIGTRTISTDDIMGKNVHVKYHIDLLSGACTAMVKCGDAVLYQYSGACAVSLPLTGETFTNVITSTIQLAASIGATVATGGAAAGVTAASAANSLMSMKPIIERAGGVSGAAGQLGVMQPYLIGEIPRQSKPENANKFMGYPSNITAKLGDLTGFTSVDIIHMENIPATNAEKSELENILKAGVLL